MSEFKYSDTTEEYIKTVKRVWEALGITTYDQAKPFTVWEHVERNMKELANLKALEKYQRDLESSALIVARLLAKIPAFGDSIGSEVSKAQLGVAHALLTKPLVGIKTLRSEQNPIQGVQGANC